MTKKRILSHCNVQVLHCPECFYMSLSLSKIGEHFFTHQESVEWQIYRCDQCGLISSHDDLLTEHMLLKHHQRDAAVGNRKRLLIDSLFIPELSPDTYSIDIDNELTPAPYHTRYACPFCGVVSTDKEVFRTHLGISHGITNVDCLDVFTTTTSANSSVSTGATGTTTNTAAKRSALSAMCGLPGTGSCFDYCVPEYKKLKLEETGSRLLPICSVSASATVSSTAAISSLSSSIKEENVSNAKASQFQSVLYNFNVVAEKIVANHTQPIPDEPGRVTICAGDPELRLEVSRDLIIQSYDPEPLRFLRNIVRHGIPIEELINFSWKGNRRGRPRLVNETPSANVPSVERKSMKDDRRMKSFCRLVEEVSKKPLPDNLGTYMHQFLSNLRNKNVS